MTSRNRIELINKLNDSYGDRTDFQYIERTKAGIIGVHKTEKMGIHKNKFKGVKLGNSYLDAIANLIQRYGKPSIDIDIKSFKDSKVNYRFEKLPHQMNPTRIISAITNPSN